MEKPWQGGEGVESESDCQLNLERIQLEDPWSSTPILVPIDEGIVVRDNQHLVVKSGHMTVADINWF